MLFVRFQSKPVKRKALTRRLADAGKRHFLLLLFTHCVLHLQKRKAQPHIPAAPPSSHLHVFLAFYFFFYTPLPFSVVSFLSLLFPSSGCRRCGVAMWIRKDGLPVYTWLWTSAPRISLGDPRPTAVDHQVCPARGFGLTRPRPCVLASPFCSRERLHPCESVSRFAEWHEERRGKSLGLREGGSVPGDQAPRRPKQGKPAETCTLVLDLSVST